MRSTCARWFGVVLLALLPIACAYHGPSGPTSTATVIDPAAPFTLNVGTSVGTGATTLTAHVQNSGGVALAGVVVSFTTDVGALTPSSVLSTASGQAIATLTSPSGSVSAVTVTAGSLSTHLLVTTPAAVAPPPVAPPFVPTPIPPAPTSPLTVSLLATARQAGLASDFSLATSGISRATWTFGDGVSVTTSDPFVSHTYAAGGTYTVGVTVTDPLNRQASATTTVTIPAATPPPPPPAAYVVSVSCPKPTTLTVSCNVTATLNGGPVPSTLVRVIWDWGDSQTSGPTPAASSHLYGTSGTYTILATAEATFSDGSRQSARTSTSVTTP